MLACYYRMYLNNYPKPLYIKPNTINVISLRGNGVLVVPFWLKNQIFAHPRQKHCHEKDDSKTNINATLWKINSCISASVKL